MIAGLTQLLIQIVNCILEIHLSNKDYASLPSPLSLNSHLKSSLLCRGNASRTTRSDSLRGIVSDELCKLRVYLR